MELLRRCLYLGLCGVSAISDMSMISGQLRHDMDARNAAADASVGSGVAPRAAAWRGDLEHVLLHFFEEADENAMRTSRDKTVAQKDSKSAQAVHMQVTEKELNSWMTKLSSGCKRQFGAIIQGQSSGLQSFAGPDTKVSQEHCAELEGTLCALAARVSRENTDASGATMSSLTSVRGRGCMPRDCLASGDLNVLARLMQSKAKEATADTGGTDVELRVDCSVQGGSVVEVGAASRGGPKWGSVFGWGPATRAGTRDQEQRGRDQEEEEEGAAALRGLATLAVLASAAAFVRF